MSDSRSTGIPLSVRNLRKSYEGRVVLKSLDLDIAAGEIFVLMGPSGSGKSVFLRHLIGLEAPDSGEILVGGERVGPDIDQTRHRLAMVFQSGGLLNSLTVEENVGLYLREHRLKTTEEIHRIVLEKLALVRLGADDATKYPSELSGGMRKRAAIARALVVEPQLILYDEPTSELDPLVSLTIGREILNLNRRTGATSVVVTHHVDLAMGIADRIAFLSEGAIVALGTPEQIRSSPLPLVHQFLNAEFKES
ncbi:MAG: ABC transporter ATP-binding protein [Limisphaerales bacterium]